MARQKWQEWNENEDNLAILRAWARAGLTDEEIAKKIGISRSTLAKWKKDHEPIREALAHGKEHADRLMENSLYRIALGFEVKVQKAFKLRRTEYDGSGKKVKEEEYLDTAEETEYVKPDVKAIIFWMKNRMPEDWKEKVAQAEADDTGTGVLVLTPTQIDALRDEVQRSGEETGKGSRAGGKVPVGAAGKAGRNDGPPGI